MPNVTIGEDGPEIGAWTPNVADVFGFVYRAVPSDSSEDTLAVPIVFTVVQPNRAPTIDQIGLQVGTVGTSFSVTPVGRDADDDTLTWSVTNLPTGLSVNTRTGVISGVPTVVGTNRVVLTVSDGSLTDSETFSIRIVARPSAAPYLDDVTDKAYSTEEVVSFGLPGVRNPIGSYVYAVSGLPTGLTYNSTTGIVSGTTAATPSTSTVTYSATQGVTVLSTTFTITVTRSISITQPDLEYRVGQSVEPWTPASVNNAVSGVTYTYTYTGVPTLWRYNSFIHIFLHLASTFTEATTYNCKVEVTGSDGSSAEDEFTITVLPPLTGLLEQADLTFIVGRRARTTRLARVSGGPSGAQYEYSISGSPPTGMTLNATQVSGTPSREQITRHTLTARSVTTGGATLDPLAPYTATFTITIVEDPTIRGVTLECIGRRPVGSDSAGRPIYEYTVGEQARLRWYARNLNTRDSYTYEVQVTGDGVTFSPQTEDERAAYNITGAGIYYRTPVFNDRVGTIRNLANPFRHISYFSQPPLKQSRVNSAAIAYTGTPERTWTGRFLHSQGSRTLNIDYWPPEDDNIERFLVTGRTYNTTDRTIPVQGRSTTPTSPTEVIYRANLIQRRGDPEYCGIGFTAFDRDGNVVQSSTAHPLLTNGTIAALFEEHAFRRINQDQAADTRSHEIRVRWVPSTLRWDGEQNDIILSAGDTIPTLGAATGGTPPYKYSLHGRLPKGITGVPRVRTYAELDKSDAANYVAAPTSASPPSFTGTVGTDEVGYYGIYEACVDSSPSPQIIWRLVGLTVI